MLCKIVKRPAGIWREVSVYDKAVVEPHNLLVSQVFFEEGRHFRMHLRKGGLAQKMRKEFIASHSMELPNRNL
jgi:hypothetical protein